MIVIRSIRVGIAAVLFAAVLLLSCSEKVDKAEFVYRLSSSPVSLDPAHAVDAAANAVVQEIYDGLVRIDPASGKIVPCIAESWDASEDGKVWIFHIKPDVKFHNGRSVTAEDFRYSFERVLNPKTRCPRTWVLEPVDGSKEFMEGRSDNVKGIKVIDSLTLKLSLYEPFAPFLSQLAMEIASVVPKEEVEKRETGMRFYACGTGPYVLKKFVPDVEISLEAFPQYHMGAPDVKKILFKVIPNDVVAYEQYKTGALDFLNPIPTGQVKAARKKFREDYHQWAILELRYLGINMEKKLFREHPGIRKAISLSIDRPAIADVIYEGVVEPACDILPPGLPASRVDTTCRKRNVSLAKELLAREGFPGGKGLPELTLLYNARDIEARLWQFVKSNLEETGFRIKLKSLEWGSFLNAVRKGECDLFRGSWVADYPDAHNFMYVLFNSGNFGAAGNYSRYSNPEYDRISERAKVAVNDSVRIALYLKLQDIIKRDVPVCPLFYGGDAVLLKKKWQGFVPSAQGAWAVPLNLLRKSSGG